MLSMDLVDNGSNVAVTGDNLEAYTEKLQHHWLKRRRIAADCVAKGYHEVLGDVGTTQLLELHGGSGWRDLASVLHGGAPPTAEALRAAALYEGFEDEEDDPTVRLFWEAVHSFSAAQRALLWKFTTGTSRVSVAGSTDLDGGGGSGSHRRAAITIAYGGGPERWPRAATCFHTLYLPAYEDGAVLRERLLEAFLTQGFDLV
jgi:hypothetical protein